LSSKIIVQGVSTGEGVSGVVVVGGVTGISSAGVGAGVGTGVGGGTVVTGCGVVGTGVTGVGVGEGVGTGIGAGVTVPHDPKLVDSEERNQLPTFCTSPSYVTLYEPEPTEQHSPSP